MLLVHLDEPTGIAVLEPHGRLAKADFEHATRTLAPYIKKAGKLKGIIIHTPEFPGWDSPGALFSHLKFIKAHHNKIKRLALSTDSNLGRLAEILGQMLVSLQIRSFSFAEFEQAKTWVASGASPD